jgi:integrase
MSKQPDLSRPLTDVLEQYLTSSIQIRSEKTAEHYRRSVKIFSRYLGHEPTLSDLDDDLMCGFIKWTMAAGLTEMTANHRVKQIRALWNWCAKRRLVEQFPTFRNVAEPELTVTAWTAEELEKLFAACTRQTGYIGPIRADLWWSSFHNVLFDTGERTSTVLSLRWKWCNAERHTLAIPAKARKGGRLAMTYPLSTKTVELLEKIRLPERDLVFEYHWRSWRSVFIRYRKLVADAGLPYVRGKSGPQKMRVTVLSMIEVKGGNATKFARHSSRQVTEESYLDQTMMADSRRKVWPPEEGRPGRSTDGVLSRVLGGLKRLRL